MVWRNGHERRAGQCIGTGCIYSECVKARDRRAQREIHFEAARLANPVFLHQTNLGRPVFKTVEGLFQLSGHVADLEEPLGQLALFHVRARSPAFAVDDLFIGENSHVDRIPVDLRILAIDKARFEHIKEQGLLLAIVFRVAGRELAVPVDGQAKRLHLAAHVRDIVIGPCLGVPATGHGGVLCGHPEGVPAHRVQNRMARRHLVARDDVPHRVVAHMSHVDAPRGIWKHFKDIVLGLVGAARGAEHVRLFPGGLPAGFDFRGGVGGHGAIHPGL